MRAGGGQDEGRPIIENPLWRVHLPTACGWGVIPADLYVAVSVLLAMV